ncbi:TPA: DNA polymerase III subunit delta, partial [Enterococcus faecium]|nr:DNA polymerase III subunit delta [Enterococcus faecium]
LLVQLFDQLVEMDYQIKTGQIEKELSFQLFVLRTGQLLRNR